METIDEIREEYERSLEIPPTKRPNQYILCPIGLIGSGKTTVMKPLAKKLGLVRISSDEVRRIMVRENYPGGDEPRKKLAAGLVDKYARMGYSIAIDSNCGSKIDKIKEEAKELNIKTIWLHINPPEEFIINKLKNYEHTWIFKDGKDAVRGYYSSKRQNEDIKLPPITYTFDTSREDLDEQIEEAARIIEKEV